MYMYIYISYTELLLVLRRGKAVRGGGKIEPRLHREHLLAQLAHLDLELRRRQRRAGRPLALALAPGRRDHRLAAAAARRGRARRGEAHARAENGRVDRTIRGATARRLRRQRLRRAPHARRTQHRRGRRRRSGPCARPGRRAATRRRLLWLGRSDIRRTRHSPSAPGGCSPPRYPHPLVGQLGAELKGEHKGTRRASRTSRVQGALCA